MRRREKDGKVAVIYSSSYGTGWYTAGLPIDLVFLPELVDSIIKFSTIWNTKHIEERKRYLTRVIELYSSIEPSSIAPELDYIHLLAVEWVPKNSLIRITAIDGKESVEWKSSEGWIHV